MLPIPLAFFALCTSIYSVSATTRFLVPTRVLSRSAAPTYTGASSGLDSTSLLSSPVLSGGATSTTMSRSIVASVDGTGPRMALSDMVDDGDPASTNISPTSTTGFQSSLSQTATTPSNPNTTSSISCSTESLATSPPTVTSSAPTGGATPVQDTSTLFSVSSSGFASEGADATTTSRGSMQKSSSSTVHRSTANGSSSTSASHAHVFTPAPAENISDSFQTSSSTFMHPTITLSKTPVPSETSLQPSRSTAAGPASHATRTVNKKLITIIAVLAAALALLLFTIAVWWLRRRRHSLMEHSGSLDDDFTSRESVVSNPTAGQSHADLTSPTIMCAGDRDSIPDLSKVITTTSYSPDPDTAYPDHFASIGHAGLTVPQDNFPSRLSNYSDGAAWDMSGSATAAVLAGNRFSTISPVPPARLSPSPATLHWPEQSAYAEYAGQNTPFVPLAQRRASNNPFRQPNRKSAAANLEYAVAYDGLDAHTTVPIPRPASTNPFRDLKRPWTAHVAFPEQPMPVAPRDTTPIHVSRQDIEPIRPWQPELKPSNEALAPGATHGFDATGYAAEVQRLPLAWMSESPTQSCLQWPVMHPAHWRASASKLRGVTSHESVQSLEPGPGAVFYNAI